MYDEVAVGHYLPSNNDVQNRKRSNIIDTVCGSWPTFAGKPTCTQLFDMWGLHGEQKRNPFESTVKAIEYGIALRENLKHIYSLDVSPSSIG